ncbi:hypothetical protein BO78DRAFT_425832 [Aspergillus sclerotiicarbonarius CBS 121057]|uniref:SP-RING-type domain-containing protein n=1 Tax=Aspergillus sclerotiicarbonarius (strain CBS 121057 / IBT 28362) TaxID=1448318 RepID=A0A319EM48_ASPSB|nr:hypothetical protein BO78DRAFT_425832 [Aspergillus sclerotiicarbonarius CBS 121057]
MPPKTRHLSSPVTSRSTPRARQRDGTPPLPAYEPPTCSLAHLTAQPGTHPALVALQTSHTASSLKTHLQHAQEKLTDAAGEINERLTDARERERRVGERRRKFGGSEGVNVRDGDGDGDGEDNETGEDENENEDGSGSGSGSGNEEGGSDGGVSAFEKAVSETTTQLEESMRGSIDAEVRFENVGKVLGAMERGVTGLMQRRRNSRRTRAGHAAHENEEEEEEEEGREDGDGAEPLLVQFETGVDDKEGVWGGLSLTERYSTNNAYIGFYRIIHDAKHTGEDIPPPPHPSTWFAHLEQPTTTTSSARPSRTPTSRSSNRPSNRSHRSHHTSAEEEKDDEIAIQTERLSLKCPLTLLPFTDPVSSTKCPHSFEREAITDMIARSKHTVPDPRAAAASGGGRVRRVRSAKCPVCEVMLTEFDLRSDPVLARRVKRALAVQREEDEDEDEGEDGGEGASGKRKRRGREIELGSEDEEDEDGDGDDGDNGEERIRVKRERGVSVARIKRERGMSVAVGDVEVIDDVEEVEGEGEYEGEEGEGEEEEEEEGEEQDGSGDEEMDEEEEEEEEEDAEMSDENEGDETMAATGTDEEMSE